MNYIVKNKA